MELIPILSTIILVATISTFILAIGAYILYKVRERKGERVSAPQPSSVQAELVTPIEAPATQPAYTEPQPIFVQQPGQPGYTPQPKQYAGQEKRKVYIPVTEEDLKASGSKFLKYTSEGYVPTQENKNTGALRWR